MLVTISEFNAYSGNNEVDQSEVALKTQILKSAENCVKHYLGYDPEQNTKIEVRSGIGDFRLYTVAMPILSVTELTVDGQTWNVQDALSFGTFVQMRDSRVFPRGLDNIVIKFVAGYSSISDEMSLIKLTIMRIATLMLTEANGNIGLTGKTYADNSRTFVNYSNYDKYLKPLDHLVSVRFI